MKVTQSSVLTGSEKMKNGSVVGETPAVWQLQRKGKEKKRKEKCHLRLVLLLSINVSCQCFGWFGMEQFLLGYYLLVFVSTMLF
jgi:hypothetical protein